MSCVEIIITNYLTNEIPCSECLHVQLSTTKDLLYCMRTLIIARLQTLFQLFGDFFWNDERAFRGMITIFECGIFHKSDKVGHGPLVFGL